jgi:hypothetical protein
MAQSQIRGSTQILDGTIPATKLASSFNLPTTQLQDGALFIKSDGTVSMGASLNAGGFKIINGATPTSATDFVIKSYVDSLVNGITIHPFCKVVAVSNSALTGLLTIDGVTLVDGDRILLTAQTTPAQGGPWVAHAGAWTRPLDWSAASVQKEGAYFLIDPDGTTYKNTKWFCTTVTSVTVDTTSVTFSQDLSGSTYTNGNGISLTGNVFATKNGNGISYDGSNNIQVLANGTSLNVSASGVKVSDGTPGQVMLGTTATGAATFTSLSGDVSVTGAGVTTVTSTPGSGFLKYGAFVPNETVGGTINGVNTTFTIANTPQYLQLYLNGQLLEPGAGNDYTISGTTITALFAPIAGDKLRAYYTK